MTEPFCEFRVHILSEYSSPIGIIRTYRAPNDQPECQCQGNPIKQASCPWGHVDECHAGLSCRDARCSHLLKVAADRATPKETPADA